MISNKHTEVAGVLTHVGALKREVLKAPGRFCLFLFGVIAFAGIGTMLLKASHATTPTANIEAESGVLSNGANSVMDSSASGGMAIQFSTTSTSGFVHPGVLLDKAQLDYVKGQFTSATSIPAPWADSYNRLATAKAAAGKSYPSQIYGSTSYAAHPTADLDCTLSADACSAIQDDSDAAYTLALEYYYSNTSDRAKYATTAINILNSWSSTLNCSTLPCYGNNQSRLETAFSAGVFAQAAEIIRYEYTPDVGQPSLNITALNNMFTKAMVPNITAGDPYSNGNWELSMAYSLINMGVFMNDHATFDRGIALWRQRVPAYIYMASDGSQPNPVPGGRYDTKTKLDCYWAGAGAPLTGCTLPTNFGYHQGMIQETCRDMSHVTLGLDAMTEGAETAYIQGVDLYNEQKARILAGLEFTAHYNMQAISTLVTTDATTGIGYGTVDSDICNGTLNALGNGYVLGWEVAYNHYRYEAKPAETATSMACTDGTDCVSTYLKTIVRPSAYKTFTLSGWQTLTSAHGLL